jgi:hypothetical protein
MTDPVKTSAPAPIPPVTVTVIGDASSGGAPIPSGTVLVTPDHQPNVVYRVITPLVAILVRFVNTFCVSLAGSLSAGGLTANIMPHADFTGLVKSAVILAACIAGVGLVKDSATVFSGLEKQFPIATGSV